VLGDESFCNDIYEGGKDDNKLSPYGFS